MNPWLILDIPLNAADPAIRAAWQNAVRQHPPEQHPIRFQQVQEAYQAIKDAHARAQWAVLPRRAPAESPADALRLYAQDRPTLTPPGAQVFRSFLQACNQPPDKA